jgi:hypothetical protein
VLGCRRLGSNVLHFDRDELIGQEEKWELDHRDDGNGWLGPSHRSCTARGS